MKNYSESKGNRILEIYMQLQQGKCLNKTSLAQEFGVSERSVQRDIEDLRCFLQQKYLNQDIIYSKKKGGYVLTEEDSQKFTDEETLAVIKILLESRSLTKKEMFPILDKMLSNCISKDHIQMIRKLVTNEQFFYIEPHHGKPILQCLWELGQAVAKQQRIQISYMRLKDKDTVLREVEPVGIMFSEYYFYLMAFISDSRKRDEIYDAANRFPTIYRVDRITALEILPDHFQVPYLERFQEGEFRKRVQFMYGGTLQNVQFRYSGLSVEAILDRLPTAVILEERDGTYLISAEVFGKGIDMWLRSQGDSISEVIYRGEAEAPDKE